VAEVEKAQLSDYLAAERTVLAWIRTGLALMGFGFVVARFGLFLQQFQIMQRGGGVERQPYGLSLWFGTALIVAGVIMNLVAAWRHATIIRRLNEGREAPVHRATLAIATCVFLALVGIGMAIYLVSVRGTGKAGEGNKETMMETGGAQAGASGGAVAGGAAKGIVSAKSRYSVDESVERLKRALAAKGVTVFAVVDHSGEAAKVGMKMPSTKLVIFGSPKGGTPLMLAAPSVAIDLPLKILVAEDAAGAVWISYNSAEYLRERHGFPEDLVANIAVVGKFAEAAGG
jgi:uncharacterized protein (DUF302 family)/uncharacterized membrane protein YidH (DUF202 family)